MLTVLNISFGRNYLIGVSLSASNAICLYLSVFENVYMFIGMLSFRNMILCFTPINLYYVKISYLIFLMI